MALSPAPTGEEVYAGGVKTIFVFVALIAVAGFLTWKYVIDNEECPKSPTTGQCVGTTTTGYPTVGVRDGGGGRGGGRGGGGDQIITVQTP